MMHDEIIEELWGIKDGIAREHGHDVRRLAEYLQSRRREEGDRNANGRSVGEIAEADNSAESAVEGLS